MPIFFNKLKFLNKEIEDYYDNMSNTNSVFKLGVFSYLNHEDTTEDFKNRISQIRTLEHTCDELRRDIRQKLYSQMLIPESRGDVLGLLENSDTVVDVAKHVLINFDIEQPIIPPELTNDYYKLTEYVVNTVDEMILACRAFFKDFTQVNSHINKVHFFEREADHQEEKINRAVFRSDISEFSRKAHLRYFSSQIAKISDLAEDVCERLSVYVIKREL